MGYHDGGMPRCVSTGPEVVRLAGMANERERERVTEECGGAVTPGDGVLWGACVWPRNQ